MLMIILGFSGIFSIPLIKENAVISPMQGNIHLEAAASGWSNATVISDDANDWNTGASQAPSIAVDGLGIVHVVWDDGTTGDWWGSDHEIMYCNYSSASGWSNATVISDDETGWNGGYSYNPSIAVDVLGVVHVVWGDNTAGAWGGGAGDTEIMYCNYTSASGWSNATVISDDDNGWNIGNSYNPSIAVDGLNNLHVVWQDDTDGDWWGSDKEIMYCNYTAATGWSNATVISDDANDWNTGTSQDPSIAVDGSGIVHVVWDDSTVGDWWGSDLEIMYCNYTSISGWSNATVISDDANGWNTGYSEVPSIAVDGSETVHVVWDDGTAGDWWGSDPEIMYCNYTSTSGWSNATVISDDANDWNAGSSFNPSIVVDGSNNLHVVWDDSTTGNWWGSDVEIMYCKYTATTGWSNATVISDDANEWNNESSYKPSIVIDGLGIVHVVWQDYTAGDWWGSDVEIMYCEYTFSSGGSSTPPIPGFESVFILLGLLFITGIYLIKRSRPKEIPTLQ